MSDSEKWRAVVVLEFDLSVTSGGELCRGGENNCFRWCDASNADSDDFDLDDSIALGARKASNPDKVEMQAANKSSIIYPPLEGAFPLAVLTVLVVWIDFVLATIMIFRRGLYYEGTTKSQTSLGIQTFHSIKVFLTQWSCSMGR